MTPKEAWEVVSTAFGDLESLAESLSPDENRLDNYPNLQEAFDRLDEALAQHPF